MLYVLLFWIYLCFRTGYALSCGLLEPRPSEVSLHSQTALYMWFDTSGNTVAELLHRPVGQQNFVHVTRTRYEIVLSSRHPLSVLKIQRSLESDSGTYRVKCGDGSYSTDARVTIKIFPPSAPLFWNVQHIGSCNKCFPAWAGKPINVSCSTWNATWPVAMEIRLGNIKLSDVKFVYPAINEFAGHVTIVPSAGDHGKELLCYVKNVATQNALITTTEMYIKQNPSDPIIVSANAKEGERNEIKCTSNGGRPAPTVTFIYNNTEYHVIPSVSVPSNGAYYVEAIFKQALSRYDNGNTIFCQTRVSQDAEQQSTKKKITVYFPPLTAEIKKLHEKVPSEENMRLILSCTVGESFPTSEIEWKGLGQLQHNKTDTYLKQGSYGSVERVQGVSIFLSRADNGRKISCLAKNKMFTNDKPRANYKLNIQYAPVVTFDPSDHVVVSPGDDVTVTCIVDSNPLSMVYWYNGSRIISSTIGGYPDIARLELDVQNVMDNGSTFSCHASNGVGRDQRRDIIIILADKSYDKLAGGDSEDDGSSAVVAIVICLLLIIVIVAVLGLVWFRRRRKLEVDLRPDILQIQIEERQPSIAPHQDNGPVYSNVNYVEKENTEKEIPSQEEKSDKADSNCQNDLVYAELDLDINRKPSITITNPEPETQYVSIDFTKRADT